MRHRGGFHVGGLMLVLMGALFLVGSVLGYPVWAYMKYVGPSVLILMGCLFFVQLYIGPNRPGKRPIFPWPLFMVLGGTAGLAAVLGYWQFSALYSGPIAMLIVGGWLLFRTARSH